jgi:hypothetical protein
MWRSAVRPSRRSVLGALGVSWALPRGAIATDAGPREGLAPLAADLLRDWCDGLLRRQIDDRAAPLRHGAFTCPACGLLHGRCGDAVYPLLHMARTSGQSRYLEGALRVVDWMKNVDAPDGAWTNEPNDATSWKGITVFGAIALGEALHHHGDLLERAVRERWRARLRAAARFIHDNLKIGYANINYPVTASYALLLLGDLLDEPAHRARGRALAHEALPFLATPGRLLWGEGQPYARRSPKGLHPIDLGYNVEESLPALVLYGLRAGDEEVLEAVTASLAGHLELMLPDGGWDNSWGTRSFKWTYWGSRTTDGCQAAYALLAARHPAFAAAALRNTRLLRACTTDGLLHGGPHYAAHGAAPCVHHTFCHAKALATVLDHRGHLPTEARVWDTPLPREIARGARRLPALEVVLLARGPWRATVSGYDWLYKKDVWSGLGGALSLLWHSSFGPLLCASLARYRQVEPTNMQPARDPDFCLTPRLELRAGDEWFSHIFHAAATLREGDAECVVEARLVSAAQADPPGGPLPCQLRYRLSESGCTVSARVTGAAPAGALSLVLPVISTPDERVRRVTPRRLEVDKAGGTLSIEASAPVTLAEEAGRRVFNLVPGFCAIPLVVRLPPGTRSVECTLMAVSSPAGKTRAGRHP